MEIMLEKFTWKFKDEIQKKLKKMTDIMFLFVQRTDAFEAGRNYSAFKYRCEIEAVIKAQESDTVAIHLSVTGRGKT